MFGQEGHSAEDYYLKTICFNNTYKRYVPQYGGKVLDLGENVLGGVYIWGWDLEISGKGHRGGFFDTVVSLLYQALKTKLLVCFKLN